jgi:hypothetical protein
LYQRKNAASSCRILSRRKGTTMRRVPSSLSVEDESLDHRDAAALAHGAKPRLDAFAFAPALEAGTPELATLVRDDVLRPGPGQMHRPAQEGPDLDGCRLLLEHGNPHGPAREMIDSHSHPPAERPHLR